MSQYLQKEDIINFLAINEKISHIKDVDSLLDRVLLEARSICNADAGSIYLIKDNKLSFEYVQNDTLMTGDSSSNKYIYEKREIAINNESIAGYVAANKIHLRINDVYRLGNNVPYTFNRSFDESASYHTQSVLTVPLITSREKIIGVMQIINAKDTHGKVMPFSPEVELLVNLFANQAAIAIERAQMTRSIILRMIKMAELRDPEETGSHVIRVGAYSTEIYKKWAQKKGYAKDDIDKMVDLLRPASMLHDVGKVAISDTILKKQAPLSDEEFNHMKLHTVYGAILFNDRNSEWDDMAAEIALNHHEKWDGTGYPGYVNNFANLPEKLPVKPGKRNQDIPVTARIVSLADVYDALMSIRSYKKPWAENEVIHHIQSQKNFHFDPEIVDVFLDVYDVIKAIRNKYSN